MFGKSEEKKEIEELQNLLDASKYKIDELEEENKYLKKENSQKFREIDKLEKKIKTLCSVMENLPEFQLPTVELDWDYYEGINNRTQKAIVLDHEIFMGNYGNYVILKFNNTQGNFSTTILVQVRKQDDHRITTNNLGSSRMFSSERKYELLGFKTLNLCKRDIEFTYPDAENLYLYEFEKVK